MQWVIIRNRSRPNAINSRSIDRPSYPIRCAQGRACSPAKHLLLALQLLLDTTLLSLAVGALLVLLCLLRVVTRQGGTDTTSDTTNAVLEARTEVRELALCFLALALLVLPCALVLESLSTDKATDGLLGRTDILVVRALLAVLALRSDAAIACSSDTS
jgi:uncharacterized membrane protein